MTMPNSRSFRTLAAFTLAAAATLAARADDLSNNLSNFTSGTEAATATQWLAASFGTGASPRSLSAVTLLLRTPSGGGTDLLIYTNSGLEPGTPVATLIAPASFPTTLAPVTFRASGVNLAANTTYWVVLRPSVGQFEWAWTPSDTGTGFGFQQTWGITPDSGSSWWTYDNYATQMRVQSDACTCPADFNCDAFATGDDFDAYVAEFIAGGLQADFNADGFVTGDDFDAFVAAFLAGC